MLPIVFPRSLDLIFVHGTDNAAVIGKSCNGLYEQLDTNL